jgi:hypothetical protein
VANQEKTPGISAGRLAAMREGGSTCIAVLEHFQEKCESAFRQEMRKNKEIERVCGSV